MRRLAVWVWLASLAPTPAQAASDALGGGPWSVFWHAVNLALLIGVALYFGRKPIRQFFADRRAHIRESLESSSRLLEEAEARLAEWQGRLARLDSELETIRATSTKLAAAERERLLADARASAERIRRDAHAAVEQELRRARSALREEASDLAMDLAERLLQSHLNQADRERLVDEFVERVERAGPALGGGR
jgi:F-type H+-transporting ATPase subunit b